MFSAGDNEKVCTQIILNLAGGDAPVSNEVEAHLLGLKDIKIPIQAKTIALKQLNAQSHINTYKPKVHKRKNVLGKNERIGLRKK